MPDERGPTDEGTIGVLVCDDNEAMRSLLCAVVELRPSLRIVGQAGDGDEAIRAAALLQPDVVLLDLAMPRRTGLEALPELRAVAPAAKIIVLSGFSTTSLAEEAFELGATRYLTKGTAPDLITSAIEEVVSDAISTVLTEPGPATQLRRLT